MLFRSQVERTGVGIEELARRLSALAPRLIALEATGGFETVVAAGLAAARLPLAVVNPGQVRAFAQALADAPKPTRSTQHRGAAPALPPSIIAWSRVAKPASPPS